MYDWLLGGEANFAVDREAAERAYTAWPGGIDGVRADALAHRALLGRVVREAPEARIVYVDHDPIVLAHAHQLLRGAPEGVTRYVFGELREPGAILEAAAQTLDFGQPLAVLLFGVLHFFRAEEDPAAMAGELMTPLVPGSYLAVSHLAADVAGEEMAETFRRLNEKMADSVVLRAREEVAGLFGGLELIEPGIVQLPAWRPEQEAPPGPVPMWCGVGRKTAA